MYTIVHEMFVYFYQSPTVAPFHHTFAHMVSFSESLPGGIRLTETATGDRDVKKLIIAMLFFGMFLVTVWALSRLCR